jgi:hypothetical protein
MGVVAHCLFSPAGRRAEQSEAMRGWCGIFSSNGFASLIRRCAPPSPRWGEEGGRPYTAGTSNTSPARNA